MSAEIAGFASKWRTQRRSRGEQRDHGTAGIARRPEPRLSFTQDVQMGRVSGRCRLSDVPRTPGVYLIIHSTPWARKFMAMSTGGHFKGKNPTVDIMKLDKKWVPNAQIIGDYALRKHGK
jgi:hypothetical protein